ncbi:MAG: dUTP diphosphatase [Tissierellia bacterium]|nr:dUTP diphosphatase [Tissierellia bacterium]
MKVKIINKSHHPLPKYETPGSSGVDLRAFLEKPLSIAPFQRIRIPTGLYLELPENVEGQVRARSGLAYRKGLSLPNGIGTIDTDYRGEIQVLLINLSQEEVTIEDGERIAQLVFIEYKKVEFQEVKKLSDTKRNEGGFGHTGT